MNRGPGLPGPATQEERLPSEEALAPAVPANFLARLAWAREQALPLQPSGEA